MGLKFIALCLVSVASPLLAANEGASPMNIFILNGNAKSTVISRQQVNRFPKGDRLPIRQVMPEPDLKEVPIRRIDTDCKAPVDVPGRCFA